MKETKIVSYDYETTGLELIAIITRTTAIATAPKWCHYKKLFFGGWNVYAIDGDNAILLETYEDEIEATYVREQILKALEEETEMIVI